MHESKTRFWPGIAGAIFLLAGLPTAQAATVSLTAFAGDTGVDYGVDGVFDSLLGGSFSLAVQALLDAPPLGIGGIDPAGEERRGVLEFDISGLTGSVVAASINADVLNFSNPVPNVEVYVYAGDGLITLDDMTAPATLVFQDEVSITPLGPIDITDALQAVVGSGATHVGLRIQVTGDPNFTTWANGNGRFSTLDIATIPLPPAAWLLGSGLLGLVAAARRGARHTIGQSSSV